VSIRQVLTTSRGWDLRWLRSSSPSLWYRFGGTFPVLDQSSPDQAFFTTDDGKTWFAAEVTNIPPFDRDGKQACGAIVIRCGSGEPFVHHLESYPPEVRKQLEDAVAAATIVRKKSPLSCVRRMLLDNCS